MGRTGSTLVHSVIATPGGTGAVAITMQEILDEGETVILPEIAWGSYRLMATMDNLKVKTYSLFEGDHFNVESLKEACREVMKTQKKLLLVINDPCHNPTGYSMSMEEWQEIVAFLNECGKEVPVVLLNDIAYIDFSYDLEHCRNYIKTFNDFSEKCYAVIALHAKALTSYGLRCGKLFCWHRQRKLYAMWKSYLRRRPELPGAMCRMLLWKISHMLQQPIMMRI